MTIPCPHAPPCSRDLRPCEPCAHCNAPVGVWCAPRCPRKPERVGEPVEDVGPECWPAERLQGGRQEGQRAGVVVFSLRPTVRATVECIDEILRAGAARDGSDRMAPGSFREVVLGKGLIVGVDPAEPGSDRTVTVRFENQNGRLKAVAVDGGVVVVLDEEGA